MSTAQNRGFEGTAGFLVAPVMARMNRDMEVAALLAVPLPDGMEVLVIGCGPGVGIAELLTRSRPSRVLALEPSRAMVASARRRVAAGGGANGSAVEFLARPAAQLTPEHGRFDLAVAVNCHQLWEPRDESTRAVARALRPGGWLVSVTHAWAIAKHVPVEQWRDEVEAELVAAGFESGDWSQNHYRSGEGLMVRCRRRTDAAAGRAYD